jgi:zinc D-Ala-D-Ala carboxypeptidase
MTQLSPHFSLHELTFSEYAARHGIDNTPDAAELANLALLAILLEGVRSACGDRPLVPTSGLRKPAVNRGVGGHPSSAHLSGRACDFRVVGLTPYEVMERIMVTPLRFDKAILEYDRWVHIQIPENGRMPRRQVFTIRRGTGYMTGLVAP